MTEEDVRETVMQAFLAAAGEWGGTDTVFDTLDLTKAGGAVHKAGNGNTAAPASDSITTAADVPVLVQELLLAGPEESVRSGASPSASGIDVSSILEEASAAQAATQRTAASSAATKSQSTQSGSGDSTAEVIARTALSVLSLGTAPLISGILRLFGGGDPAPPAPLIPYALPPSIQFDAVNPSGSNRFEFASYDQQGLPRIAGGSGEAEAGKATSSQAAIPASQPVGSPQVTIQVNAMDSRSFLDHSSEIAQAVREAMLNMHSLNDVVSDF